MQAHKSKLWYISTNEFFSELSEIDKEDMASMLRPMEVKKKGFIYYAGDRAETVYILKEGRIKITRLSEDGKELTIDILEPGDIFGELALAGVEERETSAEALEDSFICMISRENFEEFLSKKPNLSFKLMKRVGLRLRTIENRFEGMIFKDVRTRLLSTLRDLDKRYGVPVQGGKKITIKLSHQEIANLIGSTRETVTLELNDMKRAGDIQMEGKEFILPAKTLRRTSSL